MATRTLENAAERERTIMLSPFFSCGAKLHIWAAFAGVFSGAYLFLNAELIVYLVYLLGIIIAIITAFILKRTVVKGETPPFIMELPLYHRPRFKNIFARLWEKIKHYLLRAGTVIAGATVVIWFLSSFDFSYQMVSSVENSILGSLGKLITPLFIPLGFGLGIDGWKFVVAILSGLIAKEIVIVTMGVFSGMGEDTFGEPQELGNTALGAMMLGIGGMIGGINVAIPAMFSFMAFNLLSVPCMAAVAAARGELRNKKKLIKAIIFWILTAYITSLIIFWTGTFILWNWIIALIAMALIILISITFIILVQKGIIKLKRRYLNTEGEV
jgi:ferrous iron transport protein B